MGWGSGIGGFVQGYQDTMMKRHAQKQQDFINAMNLAQHRLAAATELRNRPIQDKDTETLANEYEDTAHQEMMDAEKKLNEKIGGLAKLGSMFKGLMGKGKDAGSSGQSSGQAPSDQAASSPPPAPMPQTAELSGPPPAPDSGNAPPEFQQNSAGMYQQSVTPPEQVQPALPPPPSAQPATQVSDKIDPNTGLKQGQHWNQEITAKNWFAQKQERDRLDLQSKKALSDAAALNEQQQAAMEAHLAKAKATPAFQAMTPAAQSRYEMAVRGGSKDIFDNTATKTHISTQPIKGDDGKYYLPTQTFNEDTQEWEPGKPIETGPPAYSQHVATRLDEEKQNWLASNPGKTDDEAETAVRKNKQTKIDNQLKTSGYNVQNAAIQVQYHTDRNKFYREAQEAKAAGKSMTPTQATHIIDGSINEAKALLSSKLPLMSIEDGTQAVIDKSNELLSQNIGMSREELRQIARGKPVTPVLGNPSESAKKSLVNPQPALKKPPASTKKVAAPDYTQ